MIGKFLKPAIFLVGFFFYSTQLCAAELYDYVYRVRSNTAFIVDNITTGTGFLANSNIFVTAAHCVGIDTRIDGLGKLYSNLTPIIIDRKLDIAILRSPLNYGLPQLKAHTALPNPGDILYTYSYDNGSYTMKKYTVKVTRVSQNDGKIFFLPTPNVGASGAPLFDYDGHLVGMIIAYSLNTKEGAALSAKTISDLYNDYLSTNSTKRD